MISLSDALKATRRGIYKYGPEWRALIIVRKPIQLAVLWDEVKAILEATSLGIESARFITRVMQLEKGGTIRFASIEDLTDAYLHAGKQYTHHIWLYENNDHKLQQYMLSTLRSAVVPSDQTLSQVAEW